MEKYISIIDEEVKQFKILESKKNEILEKQENILADLIEKYKPLAEKIKAEGFYFTHPTLDWTYRNGPILGYNKEKNELYVYDLESGLVAKNISTKEENNLWVRNIVESGQFENACKGLKYLENMIGEYLKLLQQDVNKLDTQIIEI